MTVQKIRASDHVKMPLALGIAMALSVGHLEFHGILTISPISIAGDIQKKSQILNFDGADPKQKSASK